MNTQLKTDTSTDRNSFLDFMKATLIFLVVQSHCISALMGKQLAWSDNYFNVTTTTFQMPLFIAISGWLFYSSLQKHSLKDILKNKLITLLVPIIFWNTVFYLFLTMLELIKGDTISLDVFIKSFFTSVLDGLWYLWCYLIIVIIICVICFVFRSEPIRCVMYLTIIVLTHTIPILENYFFGFMFPFFLMGFYLKMLDEKICKIQSLRKYFLGIALLYPLFRYLYKPDYSMYLLGSAINFNQINYYLYAYLIRFLSGITGIVFFLVVLYVIYSKILNIRLQKYLTYVGRRTMHIYILHSFFISSLLRRVIIFLNLDTLLVKNLHILNFVFGFLLAIVTVLICLVITAIINKIPLLRDFAFGIKYKVKMEKS